MTNVPEGLKEIDEQIRTGGGPIETTPRKLLSFIGKYRRTWRQVKTIRKMLESLDLYTFPDFEGEGLDSSIFIHRRPQVVQVGALGLGWKLQPVEIDFKGEFTPPDEEEGSSNSTDRILNAEPAHRVGRFTPDRPLIWIARDDSIDKAITMMIQNDVSHLPVMQGDRTVFGIISWKSIGQRMALGQKPQTVSDCMEGHAEVPYSGSIFDAIQLIEKYDCVLIRAHDKKISGTLTATDIGRSFENLSRPFLLLGDIENNLRKLIAPRFTTEELQCVKDPADEDREIHDVSNLTFGEFLRLLENPNNWEKLCIHIDRGLFISDLKAVKTIRNGVMHFNPEGIDDEELDLLHRFSQFLQTIVEISPKVNS